MLVLSRKAQEVIQIGNDIRITILRVKGRTVRVGVDAPAHLRVRREELLPRQAGTRCSGNIDRGGLPPGSTAAGHADRRQSDRDSDEARPADEPTSDFQHRFKNWPLTVEQRLEMLALATDASLPKLPASAM